MAKEEKTLSEQDRKRINKSFFDKHPYSSGAGWNEYYEGAEYEHKYQREQQAEVRNKVIDECIDIVDQPWQTTDADAIVNHIIDRLNSLKK